MIYKGKELSEHSLWDLGKLKEILASLEEAENRREIASKHLKFDKVNNKKAMEFPPPNPEFLKIKKCSRRRN